MKIIEEPKKPAPAPTRDSWIATFVSRFGRTTKPEEEDTTYRDGNAAVRFRFPSGLVAEWGWANITADSAVDEVLASNQRLDKIA